MSILVLGIGNLIMSDDSVGVRLVQRLQNRFRFLEGINLHDGGTLGPALLPLLTGVDRLLLVDAVETGEAPGTVVRLTGDDIPRAIPARLSQHQLGLADLLSLAALAGNAPREIVLWGIQPSNIALGLDMSPPVASRFAVLEARVLEELRNWGMEPFPGSSRNELQNQRE